MKAIGEPESGGRILTIVLAGGEGNRLGPLTARRAKPTMPFAGVYRLIDFPLSNCLHSRLHNVWVVQQYEPLSLGEHLANGRPWDLDRNHGGLRILHPHSSDERAEGMLQGNGDALARNARFIKEFDPELVVVLSADAVYAMDYRKVLEEHRDAKADVTMVTTQVAADDAARYGIVQSDTSGRVLAYDYKPDEPQGIDAAIEVFAFRPAALLEALEEAASPDDGAGDLGERALPLLVNEGNAVSVPFEGYWRDVGTIDSYWSSHMELLDGAVSFDPGDASWPIFGRDPGHSAARVIGGTTARCLLSPGSVTAGTVERSILGPGTIVEEGAVVRDSVILDHVTIGAGARVSGAVIDSNVEIGRSATIDGPSSDESSDDIIVIGQDIVIAEGTRVDPGTRMEPPSSDVS